MKIFQTADIHLSREHPERMEALEEILDKCEKEKADLLLISGDLFDKNVNIEDLKTDLRPLFSDNSFQTLVIPGNHDNKAFRQEDYLGDDIEILTHRPYASRVFDDVNIVAVPYTDKSFAELVEPLSEGLEENKTNILMIHCTLAGVSGGFGSESEYLPVKPSELVQTGFDYVLAGHIHSSATRKSFGETVFAYPGSPASVSSNETGKREVWKLENKELETIQLDTFHYLKENIEVLPGEEDGKMEKVKDSFRDMDLEKASVVVKVDGFTEKDVEKFSDEVKNALEDLDPESTEVNVQGLESAASIVDSRIYSDFKQRLSEKDFENPGLVEEKFLRGLSRYER